MVRAQGETRCVSFSHHLLAALQLSLLLFACRSSPVLTPEQADDIRADLDKKEQSLALREAEQARMVNLRLEETRRGQSELESRQEELRLEKQALDRREQEVEARETDVRRQLDEFNSREARITGWERWAVLPADEKKRAYIKDYLRVREVRVEAETMSLAGIGPGVFGEIVNNGPATLSRVEIRTYLLDAGNRAIAENDSTPVRVTKDPLLIAIDQQDNKPLRPNYVKKFGYSLAQQTTQEFSNKVRVEIIDIEFEDPPK